MGLDMSIYYNPDPNSKDNGLEIVSWRRAYIINNWMLSNTKSVSDISMDTVPKVRDLKDLLARCEVVLDAAGKYGFTMLSLNEKTESKLPMPPGLVKIVEAMLNNDPMQYTPYDDDSYEYKDLKDIADTARYLHAAIPLMQRMSRSHGEITGTIRYSCC